MSFSVVENSALLGKPRTVTGGASGNDPMDDVRSTLTQLTARAQRIGLENVDSRVVRNGRSLYDLSAKAAEEARQRAKRAGGDGSTYGAAQASEELFMAKQLGFDVQEQQRLLHHIQKNEAQLAADLCSNETTAVGGLGAYYSPGEASGEGRGEVDTIVARLKNEILLQTQCTVHRREKERAQEQEYTVFRAAWNSYYLSLADHLESLSMTRGPESKNLNTTATRPSNGGARMRSTGSVADFLASDSPAALEANLKAAGFAQMVRSVPPSQWCTHFAAYATEQSSPTSEDTAMLWATAELLLEPVFRAGSAATVMTYVGSSRYVMERKSFSRLLSSTMRIDPTRFEEVASMSASRVLEVLARSSSASNPWMHVFLAMRCGRYDVAVLAAERIGSAAVSAALEAYTKAHAAQLHTIPSAGADVRELYAEAETRDDVYRQAVLFLLLVGQTGESADVVHRTMLSLCRQVASSIEDALWLRLACVRTVEESAKANNIQSLAYLQKALLEDLQDLIVIAHGNVPRLACFLMHALLPCTGLRLLLEQEATYVDGLHLVLCLNAGDMLLCSAQETPIDLARHLMRYCTLVLMDLDRRVQGSVVAGTSVFHYFHKTGLEDSFVDFCQSEAVCGRLFGHAGTGYAIGGHNAALLVAQPPSPELMKAMTAVAELAATRNNACTAVHVFLVLANAAYTTQKESVMYSALSRALQVISPAMAQGFHLPPHSTAAASIFMQAAQLRHWIRHIRTMSSTSVDELSTMDIQSFELLCVLADVFASEAQGNLEHALSVFFTLPFVPQSMVEDLDVCVERYTSRSSANLLTGVAAIIPIVFRAAMALLNLYSSEADDASQEKRYQLTQRMKVVAEWVKRCSRAVHTYRECPPEVLELESQYLK